LSLNSNLKFKSIIDELVEIIKKDRYGSVDIKLDLTTDLFSVKESDKNFYSAQQVLDLLISEKFKIKEIYDYYDAKKFRLTWDESLHHYDYCIDMWLNLKEKDSK
jgi:hypothetical protein